MAEQQRQNPYAAPETDPLLVDGAVDPVLGAVWRQRDQLVIRPAQPRRVMPDLCVRCGVPGVQPRRKAALYWHAPGYYLLRLAGPVVYAAIVSVMQKNAGFEYVLCTEHQKLIQRKRIVGIGGLALVLATFFTACAQISGEIARAAIVLTLLWAIAVIYVGRIFVATRIDERFAYVKGCGEGFLARLPPFEG